MKLRRLHCVIRHSTWLSSFINILFPSVLKISILRCQRFHFRYKFASNMGFSVRYSVTKYLIFSSWNEKFFYFMHVPMRKEHISYLVALKSIVQIRNFPYDNSRSSLMVWFKRKADYVSQAIHILNMGWIRIPGCQISNFGMSPLVLTRVIQIGLCHFG